MSEEDGCDHEWPIAGQRTDGNILVRGESQTDPTDATVEHGRHGRQKDIKSAVEIVMYTT
jgi:hypothetical protein